MQQASGCPVPRLTHSGKSVSFSSETGSCSVSGFETAVVERSLLLSEPIEPNPIERPPSENSERSSHFRFPSGASDSKATSRRESLDRSTHRTPSDVSSASEFKKKAGGVVRSITKLVKSPRSASAGRESTASLGSIGSLGAVKGYADWTSLVAEKKKGRWDDITIGVTREQLGLVSACWEDIKRTGRLKELGKTIMGCLFSQNPGYRRLYPDPNRSPVLEILERIIAVSRKAFNRKQRDVVAQLLILGNRHMNEWGVGLKDFKCMTLAVVYAFEDVRSKTLDEERRRSELQAWQVLLREMAAVMVRGGLMSDEEVAALKKEMAEYEARKSKEEADQGEGMCVVM